MTKSHNEEGKEIKELARESQLVSGFGLQKQERLGGAPVSSGGSAGRMTDVFGVT